MPRQAARTVRANRRNRKEQKMQLHLSSWPEIEAYLTTSKAILIPIGSTEQRGPNGLLGT